MSALAMSGRCERVCAALELATGDGTALPLRAAELLERARTILAEHRESMPSNVARRLAELLEEAQGDCYQAAWVADVASGGLDDEDDE